MPSQSMRLGLVGHTGTWKDIGWLRSIWDGKRIIKGVQSPEDARAAVDSGADGIVVSNHGRRQLHNVSSSGAMLPRMADEIGSDGLAM